MLKRILLHKSLVLVVLAGFSACIRPISLAVLPEARHPEVPGMSFSPPLRLHEQITLSGAPLHELPCYRSTVILASQNGRVNAWHPGYGIVPGKIRLDANAEPVLAVSSDGLLVVGDKFNRLNLSCYDLESGEKLWQKRAGVVASAPVIADSSVYLLTRFRQLVRYDLRTGVRLWVYIYPGQAVAEPLVDGEEILFGTEKGEVLSVARFDGELRWQHKIFDDSILVPPVIYGNTILVLSRDGRLACLQRSDGRLLWQQKLTSAQLRHKPALAENSLFVTTSAGEVIAFDLLSQTRQWTFTTDIPAGTGPVFRSGVIYFGSMDGNLYCLAADDGAVLQKIELAGRVRTRPVFCGPFLVTGSEEHNIFVFQPEEEQ